MWFARGWPLLLPPGSFLHTMSKTKKELLGALKVGLKEALRRWLIETIKRKVK
jgi:hypothetical protein